jgi:hypothetical protein
MCCFKDLTDITECGVLWKSMVRYVSGLKLGCTLSAEKNFCSRSQAVLVVFWGLCVVLIDVFGSVFACLACACMLFSVKFHVGMRDAWMLWTAVQEPVFV